MIEQWQQAAEDFPSPSSEISYWLDVLPILSDNHIPHNTIESIAPCYNDVSPMSWLRGNSR